jgi:glutathione S-transferase
MYRVHGGPGSPFVRKVRATLAEKGAASELVPLDIFNPPPDFAALSPLRRIPVLEISDGAGRPPIPDSSAILAYLEAAHPEPALYPADPYERGWAVWIEEYADTVLAYQLGMGVMRPLLAALSGAAVDETKLAEALTVRLPPLFGYLEGALAEKRWYAGAGYSIADLAVAAQLSGLVLVERRDILDPWPNLQRLLSQALERPAFAGAVNEALAALGSP